MKKAIVAAVLACALFAMAALAGCQPSSPSDQDAIKSDLTSKLDSVKNGQVNGLDELVKQSEVLSGIDIDASKFVEAYTDGFTYEIGAITVNQSAGTATAEVKITTKSVDSIVGEWSSRISDKVQSISISDLNSLAGVTSSFGDELLGAIEVTAPVDVQVVTFTYTKAADGTWTMDDFAGQLYKAFGFDSVGRYGDLLCKQLGLSDVSDLVSSVLGALR